MTVESIEGCIIFHEGTYQLNIYNNGNMNIKHQCTRSTKMESHFDYIRPDEMFNGKCVHCTTLNVPENLQALYWLYRGDTK